MRQGLDRVYFGGWCRFLAQAFKKPKTYFLLASGASVNALLEISIHIPVWRCSINSNKKKDCHAFAQLDCERTICIGWWILMWRKLCIQKWRILTWCHKSLFEHFTSRNEKKDKMATRGRFRYHSIFSHFWSTSVDLDFYVTRKPQSSPKQR